LGIPAKDAAGMDFRDLQCFIEVVRQQNLTRAALRLGIAQPALTRRIHLLEEGFGAPLLRRHRRGVQPTEAGLIVLERAQLLMRLAGEMRGEVLLRTAEPTGQIRFGYPPSVGNLLVAGLAAEYLRRFPRVSFHLSEQFSPMLQEALLAGRIDLGIMNCEAVHPDLQFAPLFAERLWLIGRAVDWPYRTRRALGPGSVVGRPLLISSFLRTALEKLGTAAGLRFEVRFEADALTTLRELVRAGAGFLLGPPSSVSRELASGEFAGAPVRGLKVTRGLFRRRDRPMTRALHELEDMIHREAAHLRRAQPAMFHDVRAAVI
jgi:LysR family nitrogen assimilation transcriptional regulator